MSLVSLSAAQEMAKEWIQSGDEHPWARGVLLNFFDRDDAEGWSDQLQAALSEPGFDFYPVALYMMDRVAGVVRRALSADEEERGRLLNELSPALAQLDALLAPLTCDESRYMRLQRKAGWPEVHSMRAALSDLAAARGVAEELPSMLAAQHGLLTAVVLSLDAKAASEALASAPTELLPHSHGLAAARAVAATFLRLRAGDSLQAGMDRELANLEQLQQSGRDAMYLRGVLAWHTCRGADGTRQEKLRALKMLDQAQRMPFEEGAMAAFAAREIVRDSLGLPLADTRAYSRTLRLAPIAWPEQSVPILTLGLLRRPRPSWARAARQMVDLLNPVGRRVLCSALAVGLLKTGDAEGAREFAARALQLLEKPDDSTVAQMDPEAGVYVTRAHTWEVNVVPPLAFVESKQRIELLLLPELPSRERLEEIRDGI